MSHFSKIKTKITNKDVLEKALKKLGASSIRHNSKVGGYNGNTSSADIVVSAASLLSNAKKGYDIGFVNEDGAYRILTDTYGIPNSSQLFKKIFQTYNEVYVKEKLEQLGFVLADMQETDSELVMNFVQY